MYLHCNLTWCDATHISPSFVFEMPFIGNVKWLFHCHLVWCVKWHLFGVVTATNQYKKLEWGVYFVKMKLNTSTEKQGTFSHWPMGDVAASLNVMFNSAHTEISSNNAQATLKCWHQFGELSEHRNHQSLKISIMCTPSLTHFGH